MPKPVDNTTQQLWPALSLLSQFLSSSAALAVLEFRQPWLDFQTLPPPNWELWCKWKLSSSACPAVASAAGSSPVTDSTPSPAVPGVIAENLHRVCFLQQQKEWWCLWSQSHLRLARVFPTQLSSAWEAFCAHFSYHRDCKAPPSSITPDASDSLLMLFSIYPP